MKKQRTPSGRKHRGRWILLAVLIVLIGAIAGVAVWQKNNIEAVMNYTQYTQEELAGKLEENDAYIQQVLDEALSNAQKVDQERKPLKDPQKPELPDEPEQAPTDAPAETPPEQAAPEASGGEEEPSFESRLQALIDRVYALRDEYVGALEAMERDAAEAYRNLPAEKRTAKGKIEFASSYISRATELEKECDGKMDQLVAEFKALLKEYGQSMELVDTVIYTYANEKSLKKAWYLSELEKRGMI